MKEHDVRQRIESFLKRTAREVVIPASVGLGLALIITLATCSQGGPHGVPDAFTPSRGGAACPPLPCFSYPMCNRGDQQVATVGPRCTFSPWECPAERECYSLEGSCSSILCVLPEGLHCSDSLSCNPGDTPLPQFDQSCMGNPSPCYETRLCAQYIWCKKPVIPYGGICTGIWSDAGILESPDASDDGGDGERLPCCGDGIVDPSEQCDLGKLNGVPLDVHGNPTDGGGSVYCDTSCLLNVCFGC